MTKPTKPRWRSKTATALAIASCICNAASEDEAILDTDQLGPLALLLADTLGMDDEETDAFVDYITSEPQG